MVASIALNASNASKALDLPKSEFLNLVRDGILPRPRKIGRHELWDAEELRAIFRGERVNEFEDVKW